MASIKRLQKMLEAILQMNCLDSYVQDSLVLGVILQANKNRFKLKTKINAAITPTDW